MADWGQVPARVYVTGLAGRSGDPSPVTARGVFRADFEGGLGRRVVADGSSIRPSAKAASARRGMCAAVLTLEAIALGLVTPVLITVANISFALSVLLGFVR